MPVLSQVQNMVLYPWQRKHCKFSHKRTKSGTNKDKNGNHSQGPTVTSNSGNDNSQSFLEEITKLTKILEKQWESTNKRFNQMEAKMTQKL